MIENKNIQDAEAKMTPALDAPGTKPEHKLRCEAGATPQHPEGTCGAGQPLYRTNGLVHCYTHKSWPESAEGKTEARVRVAKKGG